MLLAILFSSLSLEWSVCCDGQSVMNRVYLIVGYEAKGKVRVPFVDSTLMLLKALVSSEILVFRAPACGRPADVFDRCCSLFIMS
ncbi:hypothetical protein D3C84_623690 [compost metagenome]